MLDIAWSELLIIVIIAVVVVGPKDLPRMMRVLGRLVGRARAMASEFRMSLDQLAREAELEDIRKKANEMSNLNPGRALEKAIDPDGTIKKAVSDTKNDG